MRGVGVCGGVCLSLNYSSIFAPIVTKFGHQVGLVKGNSVKGSCHWGPRFPVTTGVKNSQQCSAAIMLLNLVRRIADALMTYIEVIGQQRSHNKKMLNGYHTWSEEPLMQV